MDIPAVLYIVYAVLLTCGACLATNASSEDKFVSSSSGAVGAAVEVDTPPPPVAGAEEEDDEPPYI